MNFPQLPKLERQPMRREDEPGYEPEIWQPNWECYCCRDTGLINQNLVLMVIPNYNHSKDKLPVCQNCNIGNRFWEQVPESIDDRLNQTICQQLDLIERENWRQTTKNTFEKYKSKAQRAIKELSDTKSLRKRDRLPEEELEAVRKHEEVISQ